MSLTPPGMTRPSEYHDYLLRWRKGVNDNHHKKGTPKPCVKAKWSLTAVWRVTGVMDDLNNFVWQKSHYSHLQDKTKERYSSTEP